MECRRVPAAITYYPAPTGSFPQEIVAAPDGNLWFVAGTSKQDGVGILDPSTGAVTEIPELPVSWRGLTVGPDGNIWFCGGADTVGTINPTTHAVTQFTLPTARAAPTAITAGPDGNLWFVEMGADQIGSINPTTHAIAEYPLALPGVGGPFESGITVGPDGNLWLSSLGAPVSIGRFDISTHTMTVYNIPSGADTSDITAGPDGNLWFSGGKGIGTINPMTGAITELSLPAAPTGMYNSVIGITAGADGNLWFANYGANSVGSINSTTHAITEYPIPASGTGRNPGWQGAFDVAAKPDGTIWFTVPNSGQIGEIDLNPPSPTPTAPAPSTAGTAPVSPTQTPTQTQTSEPPSTLPTAPPAPGMSYSFMIGLSGGPSVADAVRRAGSLSLILGPGPGGDRLLLPARTGTTVVSGLVLQRFDHGAGYRIIAGKRSKMQVPHGSARPALPQLLATEKVIARGHGKHRHVVGFRVVLAGALKHDLARTTSPRTAARPSSGTGGGAIGLTVDYALPDGGGTLALRGSTWAAPTGQLVIIGRSGRR